MKIIKNNYVPKWPKEKICNNCNSILEYEQDDLKSKEISISDQRQGEYKIMTIYFECPCCKSEVKV